jgi:Protein of unknown function (DUF3891)
VIIQTVPAGDPRLAVMMYEHTAPSHQFARAFGNEQFQPADPKDLMFHVVLHHDAGWAEFDCDPVTDPKTNLPYNLVEMHRDQFRACPTQCSRRHRASSRAWYLRALALSVRRELGAVRLRRTPDQAWPARNVRRLAEGPCGEPHRLGELSARSSVSDAMLEVNIPEVVAELTRAEFSRQPDLLSGRAFMLLPPPTEAGGFPREGIPS